MRHFDFELESDGSMVCPECGIPLTPSPRDDAALVEWGCPDHGVIGEQGPEGWMPIRPAVTDQAVSDRPDCQ